MLSVQKSPKDRTLINSRMMINGQESVGSATEKLELFKSQLWKLDNVCLAENDTRGTSNTSLPEKRNMWSIAKSWTPCPLGMILCSYSSTVVLPSLDVIDHELQSEMVEHEIFEHGGQTKCLTVICTLRSSFDNRAFKKYQYHHLKRRFLICQKRPLL